MFNDLLTILSTYGWPAFIGAIALLFIVRIITIKVDAWLKRRALEKEDDKVKKEDRSPQEQLKYHDFFVNVRYKIDVDIPKMKISIDHPVKEEVFRELIKLKLTAVYDACQKIITLDMSEWSNEQWRSEIRNIMNQYVVIFENRAHNSGIPRPITSKFMEWHKKTTLLLHEYIKSLGSSPLYESHTARTNTFLYVMNLLTVTLVADAERTLNELNGELVGETYKGQPLH